LAEVKQLTRIGRSDPERLAVMISGLLAKERAREQVEKRQFAQQVDAIVARQEAADAGAPPPASGQG